MDSWRPPNVYKDRTLHDSYDEKLTIVFAYLCFYIFWEKKTSTEWGQSLRRAAEAECASFQLCLPGKPISLFQPTSWYCNICIVILYIYYNIISMGNLVYEEINDWQTIWHINSTKHKSALVALNWSEILYNWSLNTMEGQLDLQVP